MPGVRYSSTGIRRRPTPCICSCPTQKDGPTDANQTEGRVICLPLSAVCRVLTSKFGDTCYPQNTPTIFVQR